MSGGCLDRCAWARTLSICIVKREKRRVDNEHGGYLMSDFCLVSRYLDGKYRWRIYWSTRIG